MRTAAIIAAGGQGARLGAGHPKQLLRIGRQTMLDHAVAAFVDHPDVTEVVVVVPADLVASFDGRWSTARIPVQVVAGGTRRQDSVARGFAAVETRADVVIIHDAARPFVTSAMIGRTIDAAADTGAAVAALPCHDTVKLAAAGADGSRFVERTIPRERVFLAQTPQAFRTAVLRAAIAAGQNRETMTDEAALAEAAGFPVRLVEGDPAARKVTTRADLEMVRSLVEGEDPGMRIGTGYDLHRLVEGRPLILGGVTIPFHLGLAGHSDADVLSHAVTDAIFGAVAQGDIGRHFPDTDPRWKGADSLAMLAHAVAVAHDAGYGVVNVDAVVIAERPKLAPHIETIRIRLAEVMALDISQVSIKGKTNEGVGELGRSEAMAVHAVVLLNRRCASDRT